MEKEFVSYEQALALKELGFNEPCFFAFDNCSIPMRCTDLRTNEQKFYGVNYNSSSYTSQPTFSQVFRWFREKLNLSWEHQFDDGTILLYVGKITYPDNSLEYFKSIEVEDGGYNEAFERIENACIDKLIEIAKQQADGK